MSDPTPPSARLDPARLDELWDFDDPARSAARFRTELEQSEPGSATHAELSTQLARAEMLQRHEAAAVALLDSIAPTPGGVVAARIELERGRIDNSAGRLPEAHPHFVAALQHAGTCGDDFLAVDALHMLAIADPERAEEWTRKGLGLVARSVDPRVRRWAGPLRNNFGWALSEQGDLLGALRQFEAAVEAYSTTGRNDQVLFARWAMAHALRLLERMDEALEIQLDLLEQDPSDPYIQEELALLHEAQGNAEAAAAHRRRAQELSGRPSS